MATAARLSLDPSATIGAELERQRLQLRARHVRLVLVLLRERAGASTASGRPRPGLEQAIRQFSAELSSIRRRLQEAQPRRGAAGARRAHMHPDQGGHALAPAPGRRR